MGSTFNANNRFLILTGSQDGSGDYYTGSAFTKPMSQVAMMVTSSGQLWLKGPSITLADIADINGTRNVRGPIFSIMHSINKMIQWPDIYPNLRRDAENLISSPFGNGLYPFTSTFESGVAGAFPLIPLGSPVIAFGPTSVSNKGSLPMLKDTDLADNNNYFKFDYSQSFVTMYQDYDIPFLIEKGDEIRVTYDVPVDIESEFRNIKRVSQDFTVDGFYLPAPVVFTKARTIPSVGAGSSFSFTLETGSYYPYRPQDLAERFNEMYASGSLVYFVNNNGNQNLSLMASASIYSEMDPNVEPLTLNLSNWSFPFGGGSSFNYTVWTNGFLIDSSSQGAEHCNALISCSVKVQSGSVSTIVEEGAGYDTGDYAPLDSGFLYDRIKVHPNPVNLREKIPSGQIYSFTLRKRKNVDNRVVLRMNSPTGSKGVQTLSDNGFLIPEELNDVQKDNVQQVITNLRLKNAFPTKNSEGK